MRRQAETIFGQTKILDITVDGSKINARQFAVTTGLFTINLSRGNVFQTFAGHHVAIQSGYNFILEPLPAGTHAVKMHVKIAAGGKTLYEARTTFILKVT